MAGGAGVVDEIGYYAAVKDESAAETIAAIAASTDACPKHTADLIVAAADVAAALLVC